MSTLSLHFIKVFARKKKLVGYLFISPWIIGFMAFSLWPIVTSFRLSFSNYDIIQAPSYIGLRNYISIFRSQELVDVLGRTAHYVAGNVIIGTILSLSVAVLLNQKLIGMSWFRAIFYMPSVTSGVAVAMLWQWIFQPRYGLLNNLLRLVGISGPAWLQDPRWAMSAVIMVSVWTGIGRSMIIYLAALQGVPRSYYEAADLDGAGVWTRFRYITFPMITPVVLLNLVMGVISSFQGAFTYTYILTNGAGGPLKATYVFSLHLYKLAFEYFRMGYASAWAWILFAIILILTLVQMKLSSSWVYYEGQ